MANNKDTAYNTNVLVKRLQRIAKSITQESRVEFTYLLEGVDISDFARDLPRNLKNDWQATIKILQKEKFLELCENYQRAKPPFIIAEPAVDTVSSERIFRAKDGSKLRPSDYIKEFEKFIQENPEHIEAIEILLDRPNDFQTKELDGLREKLSHVPDHLQDKFSEKNLRVAYNQKLADIISIVKHAVKGEDLLTAESRVNLAFKRIRSKHSFTTEQEKWLGLIQRYLLENILMEKEDFDLMTFTREGGSFVKINQIFDGELDKLVREINETVITIC